MFLHQTNGNLILGPQLVLKALLHAVDLQADGGTAFGPGAGSRPGTDPGPGAGPRAGTAFGPGADACAGT